MLSSKSPLYFAHVLYVLRKKIKLKRQKHSQNQHYLNIKFKLIFKTSNGKILKTKLEGQRLKYLFPGFVTFKHLLYIHIHGQFQNLCVQRNAFFLKKENKSILEVLSSMFFN